MSTQIDTSRVQAYSAEVRHLAQQKMSRLAGAVQREPGTGKAYFMDYLGSVTAVEKVSRHTDTPLIETPHSRRRITPKTYILADLIDNDDRLKLNFEPGSPYMNAQAAGMGRALDDVVIAAAFGTAYAGEDGSTSVAWSSYTSTQQIAVNDHTYDSGSGDVSLTVGKLLHARKILGAAEADGYDEGGGGTGLFVACKSAQLMQMLTATEVGSVDFNSVRALAQGSLDSFMGFEFKRTERVAVDGSSDVRVIAWQRQGLGLAVWEANRIRVTERADKHYATQVYAEQTFGATRLEESRIVEILCDPA